MKKHRHKQPHRQWDSWEPTLDGALQYRISNRGELQTRPNSGKHRLPNPTSIMTRPTSAALLLHEKRQAPPRCHWIQTPSGRWLIPQPERIPELPAETNLPIRCDLVGLEKLMDKYKDSIEAGSRISKRIDDGDSTR